MPAANRVSAVAALLLAIGLLAGCFQHDIGPLSYQPPNKLAPVAGADRVVLDVVAIDKRTSDRLGVSGAASLTTTSDVVGLVRTGIQEMFKQEGFSLGAGGLVASVDLQDLYCDCSRYRAHASAGFTLRVRTLAGVTLYSHHYEDFAGAGGLFSFDRDKDQRSALELALQGAVRQVAEDRALHKVLLSAQTAASRQRSSQ